MLVFEEQTLSYINEYEHSMDPFGETRLCAGRMLVRDTGDLPALYYLPSTRARRPYPASDVGKRQWSILIAITLPLGLALFGRGGR
jgi:hypothetical protein